jgi:hypothetical protein
MSIASTAIDSNIQHPTKLIQHPTKIQHPNQDSTIGTLINKS